jgi:hypothetical protein
VLWSQDRTRQGRDVIRSIQQSLASDADNHFTYGKFETATVHFDMTLNGMLTAAEQ